MPKITIEHASLVVEVGHDHALRWFADVVRRGRRRASYSAIERNYDRARPLWGLLAFLATPGLYTMDDLTDALAALQDGTVADESTEVQRVAGIVEAVKRCGDR